MSQTLNGAKLPNLKNKIEAQDVKLKEVIEEIKLEEAAEAAKEEVEEAESKGREGNNLKSAKNEK